MSEACNERKLARYDYEYLVNYRVAYRPRCFENAV